MKTRKLPPRNLIGRNMAQYRVGLDPGDGGTPEPPAPPVPDIVWLLWWKADDGALNNIGDPCTDGQSIMVWADQSGNTYDGQPPSEPSAPVFHTNVWNGQPVARFNGTTQWIRYAGAEPGIAQPVTMFLVGSFAADDGTMFASPTTTFKTLFRPSNASTFVSSGIDVVAAPHGTLGSSPFLYIVRFNGVSSTISINDGGDTIINPGTNNWYSAQLGCESFPTGAPQRNFFNGDVGELIFLEGATTGTRYTELVAWLKYKWGIT